MGLLCLFSFLTAECQQAGISDGGLTQIQNLKTGQVLGQQPQPCVAKLKKEMK